MFALSPHPLDTTALEYQAYAELAQKEGEAVVHHAVEEFGVLRAHCVHRIGSLAIGDVAVWIGIISGHREAAFQACRYVIDEVKKRVPIWKQENYTDGSREWRDTAG